MASEEVREYFNETLMGHQLLNSKEERSLLCEVHKNCTNGKHVRSHAGSARDRLVECNMRLVLTVTKRFASDTDPRFIDLASAGTLGLITGIDRFDVDATMPNGQPYRFSTYGVWWIQSKIREELANFETRILKHKSYHEIFKKARNELVCLSGEYDIDDQTVYAYLKEAYGWSADKVASLAHDRECHVIPIESLAEQHSKDLTDPIRRLLTNETSDAINNALQELDFDEVYLLLQHYVAGETYGEIANTLGVCRERIRQRENAALRKLWFKLHRNLG